MKRSSLLIAVCMIIGLFTAKATDVSKENAGLVAKNWMYEMINQHQDVKYNELSILDINPVIREGIITYYIVNFTDKGFVLVSANDQIEPVIAYSFDNHYSLSDQPSQVKYWMGEYEKEIVFHKQNNSKATPEIAASWKHLQTNDPAQLKVNKSKDLEPFLPSNWDQGKWYNDLCPADPGGDAGHVYVGCVATSMAQVMYYYRYPNQGFGTHTYTHPSYGTQTVNFGATTYGWDGMVNQLGNANYEVARLSYQAGVAVNMDYGPDGSGAQTATAAQALRDYFRYANSTQYVQRMSYSLTAWYNLMHTNLDLKRPLMYSGYPSGGGAGHCWCCDGYQGTDFFHMNWGWSGASNGYYKVSNLNPSAGGTNFNNGQAMVIGIVPGTNYPYHCTGQKVITAFTEGTLEDGSGPAKYNNNNSCSYLFAPEDSVTAIKINFLRFDTEDSNDVVKVYGGATTSDPLLGTYSGITLPAQIIHNGNRLLITFETNDSIQGEGWMLSYSANYPDYCGNNNQTALSGTISDGSGNKKYLSGTSCQWTIQPSNAAAVMLTFTAFDTEPDDDFVKIYDLNTQELLATYSGFSIPPPVMTYSGAMFIQFKTNGSLNYQGWTANYTALGVGIEDIPGFDKFVFYPNPANENINVRFTSMNQQDIDIRIMTMDGKTVLQDTRPQFNGEFFNQYETSKLAKGIYMLRIQGNEGLITKKLVIQ